MASDLKDVRDVIIEECRYIEKLILYIHASTHDPSFSGLGYDIYNREDKISVITSNNMIINTTELDLIGYLILKRVTNKLNNK